MSILDTEVVDLLADLVAIDSVNPDLSPGGAGEAEIAHYVRDWAQMQGLRVELVERADRAAQRGDPRREHRRGQPRLLLCAHLDTVGFGGMTEPTTPRIQGDRLYGRGAYDMKAGLAAALIACREAERHGFPGEVVVAAVADEENASLGIQSLLPTLRADAAIVTEPTELVVGIAHKGFVWTEIEVTGVAAHGSRPHLGVDAIVKTGPVLVALQELGRTIAGNEHPLLGPGVVHAGLISGGQEPPPPRALRAHRRAADASGRDRGRRRGRGRARTARVPSRRPSAGGRLAHPAAPSAAADRPGRTDRGCALPSRRVGAAAPRRGRWHELLGRLGLPVGPGHPDRPVRAGRRGCPRRRRVGQPGRHRRLRPDPHRHCDRPVYQESVTVRACC